MITFRSVLLGTVATFLVLSVVMLNATVGSMFYMRYKEFGWRNWHKWTSSAQQQRYFRRALKLMVACVALYGIAEILAHRTIGI